MLYRIDVSIEVFDEPYTDRKKWYSYEKSEESEEVLGDDEYEKRHKYRKTHIGRYDLRIEIVCFYSVNDSYHEETGKYDREPISILCPISVSEDKDRDSREKCPKYGYKSTDKDDKRESEDEGECGTSLKKSYSYKSYRSECCIDESDEGLCLKYKSKSCSHLLRDDRPFLIEETEIPIFQLTEKFLYTLTINDKEIGKYEGDEEFGKDDSCIFHIGDSLSSEGLEVAWTHRICYDILESEMESCTFFYIYYEVLSLPSYLSRILEKSSDFSAYLGYDVDKYKHHDRDKKNVKKSDYYIYCRVFLRDTMSRIFTPTYAPCMDLLSKIGTKFEEYIREEKRDKK